MILAAGLSPAWQQIVDVPVLRLGEVNRATSVHWCGSGKALNVGVALHHLGADTLTVSPVGGVACDPIRAEFSELGMRAVWVLTRASTRVCTTLLDRATNQATELVENAPELTPSELGQFAHAFRFAAVEADVTVLTGSFPAGAPPDLMHTLLQGLPCRWVLDVRGDALLQALDHRPFVVKPNKEELGLTLQTVISTEAELRTGLRDLAGRGAAWVVVSQGPEAVWAASTEKLYRIEPPRVTVNNPIGCGDCLAAGIAAGLAEGKEVPDAVVLGVAAAADNLTQLLPARLDRYRVRHYAESIRCQSIAW